jgi:uncharacterized protein YxjI
MVQVLEDTINIKALSSVNVVAKKDVSVTNTNGNYTLAEDGTFEVNGNLKVLK